MASNRTLRQNRVFTEAKTQKATRNKYGAFRIGVTDEIIKSFTGEVQAIASGVGSSTKKTIVRKVFPAMEKDMKTLLREMMAGKHGNKGVSSNDGIRSAFVYTKNSMRKELMFANVAAHAAALIDGIKPKQGPTFVGDWVKRMAGSGKLKTGKIKLKNAGSKKRKKWPRFLNNVGAAPSQIDYLEKSKSKYKGKSAKLAALKKKYDRQYGTVVKRQRVLKDKEYMASPTDKKRRSKKEMKSNGILSSLMKNNSKRDFWTPVLMKYFDMAYKEEGLEGKEDAENKAFGIITDEIVKDLYKVLKGNKLKKKAKETSKRVSKKVASGEKKFDAVAEMLGRVRR